MVFTGFKLLFRDQIRVITSSNYTCVSSRETNREYVVSTHIGGTNVLLMTNKRDDQGIFYYGVILSCCISSKLIIWVICWMLDYLHT